MTGAGSRTDVRGITGRAWVMPQDYINTDAIMPRRGYDLAPREQDLLVLQTVRPGWAEQVRPGDILVTGRNFGTGSSRPAVTLLSRLGIVALVGESISEIFFRNCVSYAMPALELPGVLGLVTEGDTVRVDIGSGRLENLATGRAAQGAAMPAALLETIAVGGAYVQLRAEGYMGQETQA
ncbi:3-isopropylmalate dehydratase [Actinacidiphila sp. ITFR-21]|uniref:3-isopropylmalate dehydratase n=1 Tax=Actinacidiphila sp. ITFR-21 TaxID=3075199 RepID=UPI0028897B89|nr:3-isopropylmalate dehydratase [Streptomyces sp. ITFR-21]WNI16467.1 3-isopropylmalate dehydratase [Streptomyces sp. ITFR-21]